MSDDCVVDPVLLARCRSLGMSTDETGWTCDACQELSPPVLEANGAWEALPRGWLMLGYDNMEYALVCSPECALRYEREKPEMYAMIRAIDGG